jgi:ribonuclease HI
MSRPIEGIATDASHSTKNGLTRYRGIDLRTGVEIFHEDLGNKTVNIGEFLGVVEAVKYIIEHDYTPKIVYTDSTTAITWFKLMAAASKRKSPTVFKAEVFLQTMAAEVETIKIVHWDKSIWGEIPADFGLK